MRGFVGGAQTFDPSVVGSSLGNALNTDRHRPPKHTLKLFSIEQKEENIVQVCAGWKRTPTMQWDETEPTIITFSILVTFCFYTGWKWTPNIQWDESDQIIITLWFRDETELDQRIY